MLRVKPRGWGAPAAMAPNSDADHEQAHGAVYTCLPGQRHTSACPCPGGRVLASEMARAGGGTLHQAPLCPQPASFLWLMNWFAYLRVAQFEYNLLW